jgi:hypothetical protein
VDSEAHFSDESHLAQLRSHMESGAFGNDYLFVGTIKRQAWRRGLSEPLSPADMIEALHEFTDHLQFQPAPRWVYTGKRQSQTKPRQRQSETLEQKPRISGWSSARRKTTAVTHNFWNICIRGGGPAIPASPVSVTMGDC